MASITDYLEQNCEILNRSSYPNIYLVCPSCGTRKAKFGFSVEKGVGRCFRGSCDYRASFPQLISKVEGVPLNEAIKIAQKYSDGLTQVYKTSKPIQEKGYPKGSAPLKDIAEYLEDFPKIAIELAEHALEYLTNKRKVSLDDIEKYRTEEKNNFFIIL